jgi:hypothetical protein
MMTGSAPRASSGGWRWHVRGYRSYAGKAASRCSASVGACLPGVCCTIAQTRDWCFCECVCASWPSHVQPRAVLCSLLLVLFVHSRRDISHITHVQWQMVS